MEMDKIGIAFQRTYEGYREPLVINDGPWSKQIRDLRSSAIAVLPDFETGKITKFHLLQFSSTGTYVVMVQRISGRGTDYMSVWMYIPDTVSATGAELAGIMEKAEGISQLLQMPGFDELQASFSTVFPPLQAPVLTVASTPGGPFGTIDSRVYTLSELLEPAVRYQPSYQGLQGVIMIDNPVVTAPSLKEIKQLEEYVTLVCPDQKESESRLGRGVTLYLNDAPLSKYTLVLKNKPLIVKAVRQGFVPESFPVTPTEGFFDAVKTMPDWRKIISSEFITVVGRDNKKLDPQGYTLMVNGVRLMPGQQIEMSVSSLGKALVRVEKNGYAPAEGYYDLAQGIAAIALVPEATVVKGKLTLPDGKQVQLEITGDSLKPGVSPLKGYTYSGGKFIPRSTTPDNNVKATWGAIGAVAMLVIILLVCAFTRLSIIHTDSFPWVGFTTSVVTDKPGDNMEQKTPDTEENSKAPVDNNINPTDIAKKRLFDKFQSCNPADHKKEELNGFYEDIDKMLNDSAYSAALTRLLDCKKEQFEKELDVFIQTTKQIKRRLSKDNVEPTSDAKVEKPGNR